MASPEASRLTAPKTSEEVLLSFPAEHILLLTLNRPKSLNAMTPTMQSDIQTVLDWVDNEPSIWYAFDMTMSFFSVSRRLSIRDAKFRMGVSP